MNARDKATTCKRHNNNNNNNNEILQSTSYSSGLVTKNKQYQRGTRTRYIDWAAGTHASPIDKKKFQTQHVSEHPTPSNVDAPHHLVQPFTAVCVRVRFLKNQFMCLHSR